MNKPFIISVAAQAGGGKTTIVTALKERLNKSAVLFWDEYGDEVDINNTSDD